MKILVSGSLAYDRIMDFPGRFSDHIVPEKVHTINISFTVNSMVEKFGGTAGNIAYGLAMLGLEPTVIATIGKDSERYLEWLAQNHVGTDGVRVVREEFTAGAFITTDQADNQITGFNPGAMKQQAQYDFSYVDPKASFAIVAPGNTRDMVGFTRTYKQKRVPYIFDPGQAIPALRAEDLRESVTGARLFIANDYETELVCRKVGTDVAGLLRLAGAVIVTRGEHGSRVITRDGQTDVPAVKPNRMVDPTGAGDAFRAGLIRGIVDAQPLPQCARMGATCAAYVVETYGTQEYAFSMAEFGARFQEAFGERVE